MSIFKKLITDKTVRSKETGKGYKITRFNKAMPSNSEKKKYYLALFNPGEVTAFDGWYCEKLRHAKGDGESFINSKEGE